MKFTTPLLTALLLGTSAAQASPLLSPDQLDCDGNGIADSCEAATLQCTTTGRAGYVRYDSGTLPIVLSAPHGGRVKPDEVPSREGGTLWGDVNTIEVAEEINDALEELTGRRAHLVISHLHRSRLDPNRALEPAAEGNPWAEQAWTEYHGAIDAASGAVEGAYGGGLYVDIHGLARSRTRTELGYLLKSDEYEVSAERFAHPGFAVHSSLRRLASSSESSLDELVRGESSIGGLLQGAGYDGTPRPAHPRPGVDADGHSTHYFNGGYSTREHGSWRRGALDGVQIEHVWTGVRDSKANREAWGRAVAAALLEFLDETMDIDPLLYGAVAPDSALADMPPVATCFDEDWMEDAPGLDGLDPDLQGWWPMIPFDDTVMDLTSSGSGDALLLPADGPTEAADQTGPIGLSFDGEDDVMIIDDQPLGEDGAFTVAFSFRADREDRGGYRYLWSHGRYSWRNSVSVFLSPWGKLGVNVRGADESHSYWAVNPNVYVMDGDWHDFALVVDPAGPVVRVYLDGQEVKSAARGAGGVDPNTHIHVGGRSDLSASRHYEGDLAEIRIFGRALSDEDVTGLAGE